MKNLSAFPTAALAVLISLVSVPLAVRAAGMTEWEATVRLKLAAAAVLLRLVDARLTYKPYIGTLEDNSYFDIRVPLHRGINYALIGVCDDDCKNLNMKLYDEDGDFVGQYADGGAAADLEITPRRTQDFTLRMIMKRCTSEPCYYGLGVYNN